MLKLPLASVVTALTTLPLRSLNCTCAPGMSAPVVSATLPETAGAKAGGTRLRKIGLSAVVDATEQKAGRAKDWQGSGTGQVAARKSSPKDK